MLFNSLTFVFFHLIFVGLYWSTKNNTIRKSLLGFSSLVFYGWFYWPGLILLLLTMVVNYTLARKIESSGKKIFLTLAVSLNLLSLGFFKYSSFFIDNLILFFDVFGLELAKPEWSYWLPLGISFYTFQAISYLVDVYRKKVPAEKNILNFLVFKAFYAQLVAGPIVRAEELLPQIHEKQKFRASDFQLGIYYVLAGLLIKIVIADTLGQFVDFGFTDPTELNIENAWMTIYAFSVQILCDFWGYSTIALGVGYMYGYKLPLNFDNPYIADSVTDFWRRWHLTLSHWLRDYLYFPLGGGRNKKYRNLMITMVLAGLWHGASWNFVIYGFGHGTWVVIERFCMDKKKTLKLPRLLKQFIVFQALSLLRVFFRSPDFSTSMTYFKSLFGFYDVDRNIPEALAVQLLFFILFMVFFEKSTKDRSFLDWTLKKQVTVSVGFMALILSFASNKLDFIYFVF